MQTNLALELVRVTEAAALSAARTMGLGDVQATHRRAVEAMHHTLQQIPVGAKVVLGEGESGEVAQLSHQTRMGSGGPEVELIVLPIDAAASCAQGGGYALSVVAACENGNFLQTPDIYFEKIAVGPVGRGLLDLNQPPLENLQRLAGAKSTYVEDLTVAIVDRPRHTELIQRVRQAGARIRLIPGGEVSGALATCNAAYGIDLLMGLGKARESLLAAAALYAMGGDVQVRPHAANRHEQEALQQAGLTDPRKIFSLEELVSGEIYFAATGVTRSEFLEGIQFRAGGAVSHSLVVRSGSGTARRILSEHYFDRKPIY